MTLTLKSTLLLISAVLIFCGIAFGETAKPDAGSVDIDSIALRDRAAINSPGSLSIELGGTYAKTKKTVVSNLVAALTDQETVEASGFATFRLGVLDRLQLAVTGARSYTCTGEYLDGQVLYENYGSEWSPLSVDARVTLFREGGILPMGIMAGVSAVLESRSAIHSEIHISKTLDPCVLSLMAGYTPSSTDRDENIRSGPSYSTSLGLDLMLNDRLVLQTAVLGTFQGEGSYGDGSVIPADERYGLSFGLNWRLFKNVFCQPSIRVMFPGDGSDTGFSLSLVYEPAS